MFVWEMRDYKQVMTTCWNLQRQNHGLACHCSLLSCSCLGRHVTDMWAHRRAVVGISRCPCQRRRSLCKDPGEFLMNLLE